MVLTASVVIQGKLNRGLEQGTPRLWLRHPQPLLGRSEAEPKDEQPVR